MDTNETEEIYKRLDDDPERYLSIPAESSREGYQDMVAFAEAGIYDRIKLACSV